MKSYKFYTNDGVIKRQLHNDDEAIAFASKWSCTLINERRDESCQTKKEKCYTQYCGHTQ